MSSWGEAVELKATQFDKSEKEAGIKYPDLTFTYAYEEYYPQMDFSWVDEGSRIKKQKTTIVFKCCYYQILKAMMANRDVIYIDGRNAPYEECFKGHYLRDVDGTVSYLVQEIDNETGKVLFEKEIDTTPDIVHNAHKYEAEHVKETVTISDRNELLGLLDVNPRFYDMIDDSLKEDEELAMKAVKGNGWNYNHLIDKFKARRDFQLIAFIKNSGLGRSLPKELLSDYDFLLEACRKNEYCLRAIEDENLKKQIEEQIKKEKEEQKKSLPK